jgi:uncharacterized protein DUF4177
MSDDEARGYLEEVASLLASLRYENARERLLSIADWIGRRQVEGAPGSQRDRGDNGMSYLFFMFRYPDKMAQVINQHGEDGWRVHTVTPHFSPVSGLTEFLVCLERERGKGE